MGILIFLMLLLLGLEMKGGILQNGSLRPLTQQMRGGPRDP